MVHGVVVVVGVVVSVVDGDVVSWVVGAGVVVLRVVIVVAMVVIGAGVVVDDGTSDEKSIFYEIGDHIVLT